MFTNDIYRLIGDSLMEDGYRNITEVPASVIEEKIKEYLKAKLFIDGNNLSLSALMQELEKCYTANSDKERGLGNICFYLKWYLGMLQQYEIAWKVEDEPTHFVMSDDGNKISELITSKNIDYEKTAVFLLEEAAKIQERVGARK